MTDIDVLILGGGFAGVLTALHLPGFRVAIVHPDVLGESTSSIRARGGLAAAVARTDSPGSHARDTFLAGAGHGDPNVIAAITACGPGAVQSLAEHGVEFERGPDGDFVLKHEAAHSEPRVLSVSDSRTGRSIMEALRAELARREVELIQGWRATRLLGDEDGIVGAELQCGEVRMNKMAKATVLATGSACGLWATSSVPGMACGEGIAIAHRVGARLRDLEFVQFHPTATELDGETLLLTEALRGAGARLIDRAGNRVMTGIHAAIDLAPRDIVARRVEDIRRAGGEVLLDVEPVDELSRRFPDAHRCTERLGSSRIPVRTCAHYHMGGVATDLEGRTSLNGLWAVGEVASTGFHGANRLASNSLLEIAVIAPAVASSIAARLTTKPRQVSQDLPFFVSEPPEEAAASVATVRSLMDRHVGVRRSPEGLRATLAILRRMPRTAAIDAAILITSAALRRQSPLGSHFISRPSHR